MKKIKILDGQLHRPTIDRTGVFVCSERVADSETIVKDLFPPVTRVIKKSVKLQVIILHFYVQVRWNTAQ